MAKKEENVATESEARVEATAPVEAKMLLHTEGGQLSLFRLESINEPFFGNEIRS
jgi:hypothetical protein